ncbi:type III secretion system translocon subunit SctE [Pseudothauera rhizosphaerae]|nr:type III secretion system translocon subunit SctE [Pseudothauera rhizosphaerae]
MVDTSFTTGNNYGNYNLGTGDNSGVNEKFTREMLELYKGAGITEADATRMLGEVAKLMGELVGEYKTGGTGGKNTPQGAPVLSEPERAFSPDELALIIGSMQNKITELQAQSAKEGIKLSDTQKQEAHQKAIEKIEEAAKKMAEANEKNGLLKVFKIIGLILAAVAAIALTVLTAGAASGVLGVVAVAFAAYAVADSVMSIASEISQACGGPDISINAGLTKMFEEIALASGMNKEDAEKFGQIAAMVTQIVIAVAGCAVGGAALFKAADVATKVTKMAQIVNTCATIAGGVNSVGSGVTTMAKAEDVKAAEMAKADKAELDKVILQLMKAMEDDRERIKELVAKLDEAMQQLSSLIAAGSETRLQQIKNIV